MGSLRILNDRDPQDSSLIRKQPRTDTVNCAQGRILAMIFVGDSTAPLHGAVTYFLFFITTRKHLFTAADAISSLDHLISRVKR